MYLRFVGVIPGFYLHEEEDIRFSYEKEGLITVRLTPPTKAQIAEWDWVASGALCETRWEIEPPRSIGDIFQSLAAYRMPKGSPAQKRWQELGSDGAGDSIIDPKGGFKPGAAIPMDLLAPKFGDFTDERYRTLHDYAQRTIRVLCWMNEIMTPSRDARIGRLAQWSLDGVAWHALPSRPYEAFGDTGARALGLVNIRDAIESAVAKGLDMPIGHELYEEAWSQWGNNPRSALVIGMAAVEAGIKNCITTLIPNIDWFVDEVQSPPIAKMLPHIHEIATGPLVQGKVIRVPERISAAITKGFTYRNLIVHRGKLPAHGGELREILRCTRDLLCILDGYRGVEWWDGNLSYETSKELGLYSTDVVS